ncbi:hypothetical protein K438DRAFT_1999966 [Mycena galopus ATCC 62051]|nr:hypothetical protein K438DRAFT_1999966 [Mycena galopus ATCC 62051]
MSPARKGIKLLNFKPSNSTDKGTEITQREEAICECSLFSRFPPSSCHTPLPTYSSRFLHLLAVDAGTPCRTIHITHHMQRIFAHIVLPRIENILVLLIASILIVMPIVLSVTLEVGA